MYQLNASGLLFFLAFIFLFTGYNNFKIENRKIVLKVNKKSLFFLGCIVMLVTLNEIYVRCVKKIPDVIENLDGEKFEISFQYLGNLQAYEEKEFYGDREVMEIYTAWWQKRCDFNGFLGIEISDWNLDYDNYYYIISYGRPVESLYFDTTKWNNYGYKEWAGYDALIEFDMETPYQSGVVYIYEMNKIDLATTQF